MKYKTLLTTLLLSVIMIWQPVSIAAQNPEIELLLVADTSFQAIYGDQAEAVIRDRVALAQVPYQDADLNQQFTLRESYIQLLNTENDFVLDIPEVNGERDVNALLAAFNDYRQSQNSSAPHDVAILFSGADFSGNTVTYAFQGGICNSGFNSGMIQADKPAYPNLEGRMVGRVLGLTMGLLNDGSGNDCPSEGFLMSPALPINNDPVPALSDCSIDQINTKLSENALPCLFTQDAAAGESWWMIR